VRAPRLLLLTLTLAACAPLAHAQASCPGPADVQPGDLVGLWRAEFEGAGGATLLLEPHREYAQSLSGEVNRNGERARVAADLDDGAFTLEESVDGQRIAATWLGDVVAGSCGREIRGTRSGGWDRSLPFVLRRLDR
jgi:hypothetical protein